MFYNSGNETLVNKELISTVSYARITETKMKKLTSKILGLILTRDTADWKATVVRVIICSKVKTVLK